MLELLASGKGEESCPRVLRCWAASSSLLQRSAVVQYGSHDVKRIFEQYSTAFAQYVLDGIRNIQNSIINKVPVTASGQEGSEFRSVS